MRHNFLDRLFFSERYWYNFATDRRQNATLSCSNQLRESRAAR